MAKLVHQVQKDPKVHQDHQAGMVNRVLKVQQVLQASKERKVCARNIALWMVASFSKMVQGDKRVLPKDSNDNGSHSYFNDPKTVSYFVILTFDFLLSKTFFKCLCFNNFYQRKLSTFLYNFLLFDTFLFLPLLH